VAEAVADLARLARDRPALAGPAGLMTELLPRLYQDPIAATFPSLTPERGRAKLAGGVPLLRGESFYINQEALHQRLVILCDAVEHHQGGEAGAALRAGVQAERLDPGELLGNVLAGNVDALHKRAEALGVEPGLTSTLLRLLLIPVLSPVNTAWLGVRQEVGWASGSCPTCGAWPLLGEYRSPGQQRYFRCGLCTAEWLYWWAVCPFCGIDDERFLGSFTAEGEDARYRAATCESCRVYLKMVATSRPLSGPQLLVADLATMHLDVAGAERGYSAPE
jgi:formate dehydrogenase maturation protein FdhE